jgi:hypothetical protein
MNSIIDPNFATVRGQIIDSLTSYKPKRVVIKDRLDNLSLPPSLPDTIKQMKYLYKSHNYNINYYLEQLNVPRDIKLQIIASCLASSQPPQKQEFKRDVPFIDDANFSLDEQKEEINYPNTYVDKSFQNKKRKSMEYF